MNTYLYVLSLLSILSLRKNMKLVIQQQLFLQCIVLLCVFVCHPKISAQKKSNFGAYLAQFEHTKMNDYEKYEASVALIQNYIQSNIKQSTIEQINDTTYIPLSLIISQQGHIQSIETPNQALQIVMDRLQVHLPNNWIPKYYAGEAREHSVQIHVQVPSKATQALEILKIPPPPPLPSSRAERNYCLINEIEQMPRFAGCEDLSMTEAEKRRCSNEKVLSFVYNNFKIPKKADRIEGALVAQFIVEVDGSISDLKIIRDLGGGLGEELVRVINMMPRWRPGKDYNGKIVPIRMAFPFKIRLE